jgi:hypothetical protein
VVTFYSSWAEFERVGTAVTLATRTCDRLLGNSFWLVFYGACLQTSWPFLVIFLLIHFSQLRHRELLDFISMLNFNRQLLIQSIILGFPCQIKRCDCVWHGYFLFVFFLT